MRRTHHGKQEMRECILKRQLNLRGDSRVRRTTLCAGGVLTILPVHPGKIRSSKASRRERPCPDTGTPLRADEAGQKLLELLIRNEPGDFREEDASPDTLPIR